MKHKVLKTVLNNVENANKDWIGSKMELITNKPKWSGDWYCWTGTNSKDNRYRLSDLLKNGLHSIDTVERGDSVFQIGDIIRHNQTSEYNGVEIQSFRIVRDNHNTQDVCEVTFLLEGGGFMTCRLDQIELYNTFEDLDGNSNIEIINKKLLLLC